MKNKLLLCFRPVGLETEDLIDDCNFSSTSLSNKDDTKITVSKLAILKRETSKGPGGRNQTPKQNLIRSFSGSIRPALFEISLKKKCLKRKPSELTIDNKSSELSGCDVFSDITNYQSSTNESSASSPTALSPTSASSSNPSPTAKELTGNINSSRTVFISLNHKKPTTDKVSGDPSSSGLGLLFVLTMSLGITMFYGRVYSVFFTTLCLYFLSRRVNDDVVPAESMVRKSQETEVSARDYRKRVIMEGILARNHPRRTQ